MVAKAKVRAVLKALREIQELLPTGGIERLMDDIETNVLEPIEEKLDALAVKDLLTEKQEERQSALEEEQSEWEDIRSELEAFMDSLDEIESIIERVKNLE